VQKKFLTNVFILIAANLLIKPFWILGVDRNVQNVLGNTQYGVYANLFAFSLLFVMLLDFGINNFTSTSVAKNHSIINTQFSSMVPLKIIFSLMYFVVTVFAGFLYGFRSSQLLMLGFLSLNQVLLYFVLFFRSNISGLQYFKTDALLSVVDRALMIIFCSLFLWVSVNAITIEYFIYVQTIGYFIAAIFCFFILKPHLENIKLNFDKAILLKLVKDAYPYALLALLMTLYIRSDNILIKKIYPDGDAENGIYASANRLLEAANMFASLIATMLLSLFAKILKDKVELRKTIKTSMSLMFVPAMMLSVYGCVYRLEIMELLYKNATEYSSDVFGMVILSFIPVCTMYIFGTLLTANGSLNILNKIALGALLINFVMNIFLIPRYGALGAAFAAVTTNSFVAFFNVLYANKILKLKQNVLGIVKYAAFFVVYAAIMYFIHDYQIGLITSLIIAATSGLTLVFVFRILNYSLLISFFKLIRNGK